jgi:PST family polysaccharide transporter
MIIPFAFLALNQASNIVFQLFILKYVTGYLSNENVGVYAQIASLIQVFIIVVDLGFNVSAIREAANYIDDKKRMKSHIEKIIGTKLYLSCILFILYLAIVLLKFDSNLWMPSIIAFAAVIGSSILPLWYSQVINKLVHIVLMQLILRLLGVYLIIINSGESLSMNVVMVGQNFPVFIAGFYYFMKMRLIDNVRIEYGFGIENFKKFIGVNRHLLIGLMLMTFYNSANAFFLGLFVSADRVADYYVAERIIRGLQSIYGVVSNVVYRKTTRLTKELEALINFNFKFAQMILPICAIVVIFIWFYGDMVITILFGNSYDGAFKILKILSILAPIVVISNILGLHILLPMGLDLKYRNAIAMGSITNLLLFPIFSILFGISGAAYANVLVEFVVMMAMLMYSFKFMKLNGASKREIFK